MRSCFSGDAASSAVTLKWAVDMNGKVVNVREISGLGGPDKTLANCIREQTEKWSFPALKSAGSVNVVLTMNLKS